MPTDFLNNSIEFLKGVGPKRAEMFKSELGIFTFGDLLNYFPFRYVDRSKFSKISEIESDSVYIQVKGKIYGLNTVGEGRAKRLSATLRDDTGEIDLIWFQGQKWVLEKIKPNVEYIVFGKPALFKNRFNFAHPEIEAVADAETGVNATLQPFYSSTEKLKTRGLDSRGIAKLTKNLVDQINGDVEESLTADIVNNLKLIPREKAIINIHHPEDQAILDKAISRLKFEELFFIQLALLKTKFIRSTSVRGHNFSIVGEHFNTFYKQHLPFELTGAQKRVIKEIRANMGSGRQMNRLLQGDVGSGKTLVALMCMLIAIDNNYQACLMAPTEILAQQHFATISRFLKEMPVKIKLLTGSAKSAERRIIHQELENGSLNILIGTHALIEEKVVFQNLGLVLLMSSIVLVLNSAPNSGKKMTFRRMCW